MQTFGVWPDIDSHVSGRRRSISPNFTPATRAEVEKRALCYGDIVGVTCKKHFHGAPPPGSASPRLAAVAMESIDIDQRAGRARPASQPPRAEGILPWSSASYSLECPRESLNPMPRGRSLQYFEKVLEADRYAKLIGRPHAGTEKEIHRQRLALELERQQKCDDTLLDAAKDDACSGISALSTAASERSLTPISELPMQSDMDEDVHGDDAPCQEDISVPLAVRRVMASLAPSAENIAEDLRQDLQSALSQKLGKSKALPCKRRPGGIHHGDEAPGQERVSVPLGMRRVMSSLMPTGDNVTEDFVHDLQSALSGSLQTLGKSKERLRNSRLARSPPCRPAQRNSNRR